MKKADGQFVDNKSQMIVVSIILINYLTTVVNIES